MIQPLTPPKTTAHLEMLRGLVTGKTEPPPIAQLLGITAKQLELGRSTVEMQTSRQHANPMGTLHGGILCDLADLAMGTAFASTLEDDESFTTLDLTTKFFKPVWTTTLTAVAQVTRRTRTLGLIECDITDETGSLVAKVFSSCMVLRGTAAQGR